MSEAKPRVNGRLSLEFQQNGDQTIMQVKEQLQPLKVVRAFELADGAALVHLHNLSGGVLGGGHLTLTAEVGPGARAQITSTGATRIYRNRAGSLDSYQLNQFEVAEGGLLEFLPDQLIPYAGSRYRQETRVKLGQDAGLFWWEVVAPGREAKPELFEYERLQISLDITAENKPIALERVQLEPAQKDITALVRLGNFRYFASFYICRVGLLPSRWLELEQRLDAIVCQLSRPNEILWGGSTLTAHGLVIRAVSMNSRAITAGLLDFWRCAKLELYGQVAIPPRKVY